MAALRPKFSDVRPDPYGALNPDEPHALEPVADGLFRFIVGAPGRSRSGLVLVNDSGIAVVDSIRTSGALWLAAELGRRFSSLPVRYVIYSHAHFDHIGGGWVFAEQGATVVSHRNAVEPILGERLPTAAPELIVGGEHTLELGSDRIEVRHIAPSHSNSLLLVRFPRQRAIQAVDITTPGSVPFNEFPDFYYDGWVETLQWILRQDIDIVEGGHHRLGSLDDVRVNLEYLTSLHDQIVHHVRAGRCWEELFRKLEFAPEFRALDGFEKKWILNAMGMHRWVIAHRWGVW